MKIRFWPLKNRKASHVKHIKMISSHVHAVMNECRHRIRTEREKEMDGKPEREVWDTFSYMKLHSSHFLLFRSQWDSERVGLVFLTLDMSCCVCMCELDGWVGNMESKRGSDWQQYTELTWCWVGRSERKTAVIVLCVCLCLTAKVNSLLAASRESVKRPKLMEQMSDLGQIYVKNSVKSYVKS